MGNNLDFGLKDIDSLYFVFLKTAYFDRKMTSKRENTLAFFLQQCSLLKVKNYRRITDIRMILLGI